MVLAAVFRATAAVLFAAIPAIAVAQDVPSGLLRTTLMPPTYAKTASENVLRAFDRPYISAAETYRLIAGRTRLTLYPGSPVQVAYNAPDGTIYLWFPQSGDLVRGRWFLTERKRELLEGGVPIKVSVSTSVCSDYSGVIPNIFAPEWQRGSRCMTVDGVRRYMLDSREGDVLGLATGRPPPPTGARTISKIASLERARQ